MWQNVALCGRMFPALFGPPDCLTKRAAKMWPNVALMGSLSTPPIHPQKGVAYVKPNEKPRIFTIVWGKMWVYMNRCGSMWGNVASKHQKTNVSKCGNQIFLCNACAKTTNYIT